MRQNDKHSSDVDCGFNPDAIDPYCWLGHRNMLGCWGLNNLPSVPIPNNKIAHLYKSNGY